MTSIRLRDYQVEARQALRNLQGLGAQSICATSPCGSGKTVLAADLIAEDVGWGERVVFLAPKKELVTQCYQKLIDFGVIPDALSILMGGDRRRNLHAPVQVASWDTLRNFSDLPPASRIYADECHTSLAKTRLEILRHYHDAGALTVGLTASPWRGDGRGLGEFYQRLYVVTTVADLIRDGWLCEATGWTIPEERKADIEGVPISGDGDYEPTALHAAVAKKKTLVGDIVALWKSHALGVRTFGFAINVAHSREMTEAFLAAGIPSEHVDGNTDPETRAAILGDRSRGIVGRLELGVTQVVWNVNVAVEGVDIPAVKCAILAAHTASTTRHVQQIGRPMRPWFMDRAVLLDPSGNLRKHGLPTREREFRLDGIQKRTGAVDGGRTCAGCFCVMERWETVCPGCGRKQSGKAKAKPRMVRTEAGELVEFRDEGQAPTEDEKRLWWLRILHVPFFKKNPGAALGAYRKKWGTLPPLGLRRMINGGAEP